MTYIDDSGKELFDDEDRDLFYMMGIDPDKKTDKELSEIYNTVVHTKGPIEVRPVKPEVHTKEQWENWIITGSFGGIK